MYTMHDDNSASHVRPLHRTATIPASVGHPGAVSGVLRALLMLGLVALLPLGTGCLNPEFLNQTTGGLYPIAPVGEPYLLVRVINDTEALVDLPIHWEDGLTENEYAIDELSWQARDTGILLRWPVLRVGIGTLDAPFFPSIVATLEDGTTSRVPFGHQALEAGVDYESGDTVIFYIVDSTISPALVTVSLGLIDADTQPVNYRRENPFETVGLVLTLNGF